MTRNRRSELGPLVPTSSNPILLRTNASTGRGMGTPLDSRIEEQIDKYAFLFGALGVTFRE